MLDEFWSVHHRLATTNCLPYAIVNSRWSYGCEVEARTDTSSDAETVQDWS